MGSPFLYYDVFPRIVRAGSVQIVTIRPLFGHVQFQPGQVYQLSLIPCEGVAGRVGWVEPQRFALAAQDGVLRVPCTFDGEQEYVLALELPDKKPAVDFRLFALEPDLFVRRPFKGDFHLHTCYSDGVESPAYVAASCRKIGLDFMAITDHHIYAPSLEAMRVFSEVETGLRIYPGEEVHPPDNCVHVLNFGGAFSVNELFRSDAYLNEVKAIEAELDLPEGVDRYPYASCVWCYQQIRAGGGLGVFCHPYWFYHQRYDVPQYLTSLLLERQPFDALELIGGYHRFEIESNTLQVARYHEERAAGKRIPIVGVSDSHGCETGSLFGWYYTVAFSPSSDLPDLVSNIKDLYSVAVEALPGEPARAFGPFRLVRYTQFLLRELFPAHDDLCREEGRLMLAHAAGDARAAAQIVALKSRTTKYYDHCWAAK
jgi:hypothetical protein